MKFTVVKLFNHKALGLNEPHYAVIADMPADLGGDQCVMDVLPVSDHSREDIACGFNKALENMPYRAHEDGSGEIDFLNKDYKGNAYKQSTGYYPAKSLLGLTFQEEYKNWLCWRARVGLWVGRDRHVLSDELAARVLETVSPAFTVEAEEFSGLAVHIAKPKENGTVALPAPARGLLTHGRAPV